MFNSSAFTAKTMLVNAQHYMIIYLYIYICIIYAYIYTQYIGETIDQPVTSHVNFPLCPTPLLKKTRAQSTVSTRPVASPSGRTQLVSFSLHVQAHDGSLC